MYYIYVYIYIYILCIYSFFCSCSFSPSPGILRRIRPAGGVCGAGRRSRKAAAEVLREYLSTGYGLRFSTEICWSKREKKVFHEYLQEYCFVLTALNISRSLRDNVIYESCILVPSEVRP